MDKLFDAAWQPLKPLPVAYPSFYNSRRVSGTKGGAEYDAEVKKAEKAKTLVKAENKAYAVGEKNDPRPTPQRRGFAKRRGLAQRYWHGVNVALLPFKNKAMAASIGCSQA